MLLSHALVSIGWLHVILSHRPGNMVVEAALILRENMVKWQSTYDFEIIMKETS